MTHSYYNTKNFPHFIAHNGNWDIYARPDGYCAAIPTKDAALIGCLASHAGDSKYIRATHGLDVHAIINAAKTEG